MVSTNEKTRNKNRLYDKMEVHEIIQKYLCCHLEEQN